MSRTLLIGIAALAMSACGTTGQQYEAGDAPKLPAFVLNQPAGCGVGSAKFRGNINLARAAAVSSARADLSRQLKTQINALLKRYQQEGEVDGKDMTEETITSVSKDVTSMSVVGTRATMTKVMEGNLHALVCLDPETFASSFERMNKLSESQRAALKKRAAAEFDDLDREIEKLKAQN